MKRYLWLLCLASMLFAGNTHITLSDEEQRYILSHRDIKVCTNPSLMPFEVLTPEGNHEGIGADLLSLVAGRVGLTIKIIQTYTWEDSLEKAKDAQCDIVSLISQTPELDAWLLFSDPILVDKNVLDYDRYAQFYRRPQIDSERYAGTAQRFAAVCQNRKRISARYAFYGCQRERRFGVGRQQTSRYDDQTVCACCVSDQTTRVFQPENRRARRGYRYGFSYRYHGTQYDLARYFK